MFTENFQKELAKKLKTNHQSTIELKKFLVKNGMFEEASQLREFEKKHFPVDPEIQKIRDEATSLRILFNMIEIETNPKSAWMIFEAFKKYQELGGDFDLMTSTKIIKDAERIFDHN